jgi:hypothetical protein
LKRAAFPAAALVFLFAFPFSAQEAGAPTFDIDSLFGEGASSNEAGADESLLPGGAADSVFARGIVFDGRFEFWGGLAPGWNEVPWARDGENEFSLAPGAKMKAAFGIDARISSVFRVKTEVRFEIPNFAFKLGDFFFDYNIYDAVFVRAGKYALAWGISPNFRFTDLLARVPRDGPGGDSYIIKADIPVGIGGFQVLALTRANLTGGVMPGLRDIGGGGKFNIAVQKLDFDIGAFYQDGMPVRGFFSLKTTAGGIELYNEWLFAADPRNMDDTGAAVNLGFAGDFFGGKLTVNGELFLNDEDGAFFYTPETTARDAEINPFVGGLNLALNLLYRVGGKGNLRLFTRALYAPLEHSAHIVPGFLLSPLPHVDVYFALPMALGNRDGYYYSHNADVRNRPFSITMAVTLSGNVRRGFYY